MAAPAADARGFCSAVPERMAEHCTNGSVRMAHSTQPEGLFEGHRLSLIHISEPTRPY